MPEYPIQVSTQSSEEYREISVTLPAGLWEAVCDECSPYRNAVSPSDMLAALVQIGLTDARQGMTHQELLDANATEFRKTRHKAQERSR